MDLKIRSAALAALLNLVFISMSGQTNFIREDAIIVLKMNGDTMKNPWVGGFNSVQFSEIDLNLDGIKDLLVFDRSGNRISTFVNAGKANQVSYTHEPSYIQYFPEGLHDWVLLRDYNCDGKMDIFTYSSGGVAIYQNTSTTQLSFSLITNLLLSDYQPDGPPSFVNLFISSTDIPAIDDIDGDGDLDVLTFSILGSKVEYHKNLSIEKYGTCDSLDFQLRNNCWGYFTESGSSSSVVLYDTCAFNNNNPERIKGGNKHSGSTLLTLDVDANNSKDLVVGDVSFSNFTLLTNSDASPNLTKSSITAQDPFFPKNNTTTIATKIDVFPAGFYLDVNNDNVKDLIAAPNCSNGCKNSNNVWYYNNANATNQPDFNLVTEGFIQEEMVEVGEDAHPVFFDYNSDGLMDIVIGNHYEFDTSFSNNKKSTLSLYKNVGTASIPAYQLITNDYANISTINLDVPANKPSTRLIPTFGDIDNDGDQDMIIGDFNGAIHLFTNSAGAGNVANFTLTTAEYFGIDIGNFAAPQLVDLNKDLILDLVIGRRDGFFSYYENTGTATTPTFTLITNTLGQVNTKRFNEFNGNSAPVIFDNGGSYSMLAGATNGWIYQFGNIDGNLAGTFTIIDSTFLNIKEGTHSFISLSDVTNDGKLDMLVGNYAGGITFYKGDNTTSIKERNTIIDLSIYPNPTNGLIQIDVGNNELKNASIQIITLLGETIIVQKITSQKTTLNLNSYAQGIYLIKFSNEIGSRINSLFLN